MVNESVHFIICMIKLDKITSLARDTFRIVWIEMCSFLWILYL